MKCLLVIFALVVLPTCPLFAQENYDSSLEAWNKPRQRIDSINLLLQADKVSPSFEVLRRCEIVRIYNDLGRYYLADSALQKIDTSTVFSTESRFRYLLTVANTKKFNNSPSLANDYYKLAIAFALKNSHPTWAIEAIISQAELFRKYRDYNQSQACLTRAFELLKNHPNEHRLRAYAHNRKAAVLNERYGAEKALKESLLCVKYALKVEANDLLASSYNELGYIYNRLGKKDSVEHYFRLAENSFHKAGMYMDAINARANRLIFLASRPNVNIDETIQMLQVFIDEVKNNNIPFNVYTLYDIQHKLEASRKNYQKALEYYQLHANEAHRHFMSSQETQLEKIRQENRNSKIKLENQKIKFDLITQSKEIQNKNWIIYSSISSIILLGLVTFLIYRSNIKNKRFSSKLREKNKQKDFLIQEVHHRVKNNLDFIQTLLMMQAESYADKVKAQALKEATIRLTSITMVHEMLYTEESEGEVNVKLYVHDLMNYLLLGFNGNSPNVHLDLQIDEHFMSIQDCTALGLLITECFTNSMKHAFTQVKEPLFHVIFTTSEPGQLFTLKIEDNGVGQSEKKEPSTKKSLGMRLIDIFSRQLKGEYTMSLDGGFFYQLKVPKSN